MNLRAVFRLAFVLTASQLRGTRSQGLLRRFWAKPISILIIDLIAFFAVALISYRVELLISRSAEGRAMLEGLLSQGLAGLPVFAMSLTVLAGLLWEISQPYQVSSSDAVNWLPLSASEYVIASSASIVYVYSLMLAIGLGLTLPLASALGYLQVWALATALSIVAMFTGAFGVEILRAITNRVSSAFYRRGGRSAIVVRLAVTVLVLAVFQLFFNARWMFLILESVVAGINTTWFVPVAWPSLAILRSVEADARGIITYGLLTVSFSAFMFLGGVELRRRYWVPAPVSIRVTTTAYAPKIGLLGALGFNAVESAIIRKDLRSLVRRREMARFLAIPVVFVATILITSTTPGSTSAPTLVITTPIMLGAAIVAQVISMTSIGQEGQVIWAIYSSPILPKELVRAKISSSAFISAAIFLAIDLVMVLALRLSLEFLIVSIVLGLALSIEQALLGVGIGARFPEFTETVRSRYVTVTGSLVGGLTGIAAALITLAPLGLYLFLSGRVPLSMAHILIATLAVAAVISWVAYRHSLSAVSRLLSEQPT